MVFKIQEDTVDTRKQKTDSQQREKKGEIWQGPGFGTRRATQAESSNELLDLRRQNW
jgi:hypothetical protein